jgi:D-glycero-D-manno-heptose 1,7-bisphosphate phosphatase
MRAAARRPLPQRPAVFVDKDGTLIHDLPYNTDPARVRFTPHAIEGLCLLARSGFALFVATNQRGLATGRIRHDEYDALRAHIEQRLHDEGGITLQGWYTCPHASEVTPHCGCRKPAPGLLQRAADEHGIDLSGSWMVGDILDDVEAGRRAGCCAVLLDVGNETEWQLTPQREPHRRCPHLLAAAQVIVAKTRSAGDSR